jgi:amino acid adenylation domain-containing protein
MHRHDLADVDELSLEDRELFTRLLEEEGVDSAEPDAITRRQDPTELPLSFAQQRLWFLLQLEPGSPAYNMPAALHLEGSLDVPALARSFGEVVRRHEGLRATFRPVDGEPVQVLATTATARLPVIDLEGLPDGPRAEETRRLAEGEARSPFDLIRGPLLRSTLIGWSETGHVLLVTLHHIVGDRWSIAVLVRELCALYEAYSQVWPSPLAELPIQYADYAAWQRQRLTGNAIAADLAYWRSRLADVPPSLDLPRDRPREPAELPSVETRSATETLRLGAAAAGDLASLARRQGTTSFSALLAVFTVLLSRHSGQDDVVVGVPIAGRDRKEVEGLIGIFLNNLVLRTDLSGDPTFLDLLGRVREGLLEAVAHQDLPFEKLVQELRPERYASRAPLFQILFNQADPLLGPVALPRLAIRYLPAVEIGSKFDLTVYVTECLEGVDLRLVYDSSLFSGERIRHLLDQFAALVTQVAQRPGGRISDLSLVTTAARAWLPDPGEAIPEPFFPPVERLFLDCAQALPEQVALCWSEGSWTFSELATRARGVARAAAAAGAGPGVVVAVSGRRCPELIAGMLGVLLSGGALLILDRELPAARLRAMVEQARPQCLIYAGEPRPEDGWLRELGSLAIVSVPRAADLVAELLPGEEATGSPDPAPAAPAYVFFTSGTTGRPKAILGRQSGLSHFLTWQREAFGIGPGDRVAQLTGLSFDVVLRDVFLPLTGGATLHLPEEADLSPERIFPWLEEHAITVLHAVPSLASAWLRSAPPGSGSDAVRWTFFAGEPLLDELVRRWRAAFPRTEVVNLYGPTETTLAKCFYRVPDPPCEHVQPVGTPLPQTQALVLRGGEPCGIGEVGEIVLRTPFRSLGYLDGSVEDRVRFRPNPFRNDAADLLYFTGDRGRYRLDGSLEILGRLDEQVKIRGVRIEPAEVRAALSRDSAVVESAVVVREDRPGDPFLTAYLVLRQGAILDPAALRRRLRQELPAALVPAAFVVLDKLPLTPNGKLDRRALPAPGRGALAGAEAPAPPRTPVEEILAGLWCQLLGRDRVGVHDDFFALGGHSLLGMQLISRLREVFHVELPVTELFGRPTIAELSEVLEQAGRESRQAARPPIVPVPRQAALPLSFAQQRLWFLDRLEPGGTAYNIPQALLLRGPIDRAVLAASLGQIVRRHESLRTTFSAFADEPVQRIAPPGEVALPLVDLSGLPAADRASEAWRLLHEEGERPFDLTAGPLLRAGLLTLATGEHVVFLTLHHIAGDGWSMGVLIREMGILYRAYAARTHSPLPELPVQYADFASWQRQWLTGEVLEAKLVHWRGRLAGLKDQDGGLELPMDRPRPTIQHRRAATLPMQLGADLVERLRALSMRGRVSLFMTLLGAFQLLAHRYSRQTGIVVGTPVACRNDVVTEPMIGLFVNMLVLFTDLSGEPDVLELLGRVRGVTLAAYANQDLPFEKLVEDLQPVRALGHTPLFQVVVALNNTPRERLDIAGVESEVLTLERTTTRFDLSLSMVETGSGIEGVLEYSRELFDEVTIDRLREHYRTLLREVASRPERRVSALPLLSAAERHQLLHGWNDTRETRAPLPVHEAFMVQAESRPDAVAVRWRSTTLTYGELARRSGRLAHRLRGLGAGPEVRVGLALTRSPALLIGLLGVLRSGGAYIPLDPSHPRERLAMILEDGSPSLVITEETVRPLLPEEALPRLIGVDPDAAGDPAADPAGAGLPGGMGEVLAYLIFTSGSTGRPKGVEVPQRALANFLAAMKQQPGLRTGDTLLAITTLSFDIAALELLLPLTVGACVVVVDQDEAMDGRRLAARLAASEATVMQGTPATWRLLLEAGWQGDGRLVALCGGEALPAELALRLRPRVSALWNLYGPTETTVWSAACKVEAAAGPVAIAGPIANTSLYVLDPSVEPAPIGIAGELYIGGTGVARGYRRHPDLTAERFLPDPFAGGLEAGARMYRTGDLARRRRDGGIDFLGRIDHQVKVRGFRIELGEVEAALVACAGVSQAVVTVREDPAGGSRLAAYLTAEAKTSLDPGAVRRELKGRLPQYMVPGWLVLLDRLPLTPSGKVDRRALPPPEEPATGVIAGRWTPVEEVLTGIFSEVLHVERVEAASDFFELGGHSLLATRLVSRVRAAFGVELPLSAVFAGPTLTALAATVEQLLRGGGPRQPAITPLPRHRPLPLSFAQQRLWFLMQVDPESPAYNLPLTIRIAGNLNRGVLPDVLSEIVRRHEVLRTTYRTESGTPVQVISPAARIAVPEVDLCCLPQARRAAAARRLVLQEGRRPFDLLNGPVIRACLVRTGDEECLLAITLHHIAADGWSLDVFLRELGALYEAFVTRRRPRLPGLRVQYADYASWQRQWLSGEPLATELAYWRGRLGDSPPVLELPADHPRPRLRTLTAAARQSVDLPLALLDRLRQAGRGQGATLFMTVLAAFMGLLGRYSGQDDLSVGTPVAGRGQLETEPLIGFFVNMLVLRADLRSDPSFNALQDQVRNLVIEAFVHGDLPFEKLVDELKLRRDLSHTPLFQVVFQLQNRASTVELPGLRLSLVEPEGGTAMFDIRLALAETATGLTGFLEYNTDLFDAPTPVRLAGHLRSLLAAVSGNGETRLSDWPLLSPSEWSEILIEWNDTAKDCPLRPLVHEMFAIHAARSPWRTAVASGQGAITYGELNAQANRLAHKLRRLGVGPDVLVAICTNRTLDRVVGIVGATKAGGATVSLDPTYPKDRLAFLLADAQAPVLLTERKFLELLPETGGRVICLDDPDQRIPTGEEDHPPVTGVTPDNLAYVVYTSGSTGKPKGVEIPHAGLKNLVRWHQDLYGVRPGDRGTQVASPAFDASIWELWPYLAGGASLHIPDDETRLSSRRMIQWWSEEGITLAYLMTPLAEGVLEETIPAELDLEVRALIIGGDRLVHRPAAGVGFRLMNHYGPAEYTVTSTVVRVPPAQEATSIPTIGRPIDNTVIYVLDRHAQPVAVRVPGELFVGGLGLARGYLRRPDLTAEKFVPDPWSEIPGARLYRTGDLVRFLPDGDIDFLGRLDHQVKLRGLRIELGEIESVLGQQPELSGVAVLVREDRPGDRRLVAYVVPAEGHQPTSEELRGFLKERLPEYMVPAIFITVPALPLTPNGKVDWKALPAPEYRPEAAYAAPQGPLEEQLAAIWSEVLNIERVGRDDNFFDLGGNSLILVQLRDKLEAVLGRKITMLEMFQHTTLRSLAAHLGGAGERPAPVEGRGRDVKAARGRMLERRKRTRAR